MENVVMPQIKVDYSDERGSFSGSVFYEVQRAAKPLIEAVPIVCTIQVESQKVFTDLAAFVPAAIALVNPIMSKPYKPNFEMKDDGQIYLPLTPRQCELIIDALVTEAITYETDGETEMPFHTELRSLRQYVENSLSAQG